jgi:hypothetical protein
MFFKKTTAIACRCHCVPAKLISLCACAVDALLVVVHACVYVSGHTSKHMSAQDVVDVLLVVVHAGKQPLNSGPGQGP